MLGDGFPRFQVNLQRPQNPLPVEDPVGGVRIDFPKPGQHGGKADFVGFGFQLFPDAGGRKGGKVVAPDEAVHIQPGSSGDDGGFSPGDDVVHNGGGHGAVPGHGKVLVRLRYVDHMVGDALHLLRARLGGADVHAAVDLHGVAGDHLAV